MSVSREERLTVVIPVYNRERELWRCLDSIADQSLLPGRVIIVDDGSTDGTVEAARRHPVGADVLRGDHRGAAAARNVGLENVVSEWTMFFDSDDTMEAAHIATAMGGVGDDVDIVGWDVLMTDLKGGKRVLPFMTKKMEWNNLMHGTLGTQRYMGRTELFRRAGGWNDDVRVWNDIELGSRLLVMKPRVVKVDGLNVNQLRTAESITGRCWSENLEKYDTVFKAWAEGSLGHRHPEWVRIKKAILSADIGRENHEAGRAMYHSITGRSAAVRFAYHYRRLGLRGAARLLGMVVR